MIPPRRDEARAVQLLDKRREPGRDDRVEHDIGTRRHDVVDDPLVVGVIEREVLLADDLAAFRTDHLTHLLVERVRPDVVGRRHVEAARPRLPHQPREERIDLLRRHRARAEDQRVALLPLVLLRVDVELPGAVHDRSLDGLSGRAVDAPDDDIDLALDEPGRGSFRHGVIGCAVLDEQLDRPAEQATARVDVVDHHLGEVDVGDTHERERAGLVGDETEPGRAIDRGGHRGHAPYVREEQRRLGLALVSGLFQDRRDLGVGDELRPSGLVPVEERPHAVLLGGVAEHRRAVRPVERALLRTLRAEHLEESVDVVDSCRGQDHECPFRPDRCGSRLRPTGSDGVRVILRNARGRGIGRPTHFRARPISAAGQPAATTWCFTAQRVAATRLDTPIFV